MKINSLKKGFTILEISIALIVISILAAIFIPSFLNVGIGADKKSDEANCDGINSAIDAAEVLENISKDIDELQVFLTEGGYFTEGLTMLVEGNCLVWDKSLNRALIVNIQDDMVVYPKRYTDEENTGDWYDIANKQRYPCPVVFAREKFVDAVNFYRGNLKNAPKYTGEQADERYALMVAEIREVFRGYDKSAVCYSIYDRDSERLLTDVLTGYLMVKRTFAGTIPLGENDYMETSACTVVEVANEEGYVIDFFNGYIDNIDENLHYFYADGRLNGELDTAQYLDNEELIFDEGVFMFPLFQEFIVNEGENYTTTYFSVEIVQNGS